MTTPPGSAPWIGLLARAFLAGPAARALPLQPGEGRRTALLYGYLFLAAAIFVLGRTVRDTLFLSRYSLAALPWMFACYGVAAALVAALYGPLVDRVSRGTATVTTCLVAIGSWTSTWALVRGGASWVYPAFYVWQEVLANLLLLQLWTLANDLFDPRAARRVFPFLASARVLGGLVVALLTGVAVRTLGTPQLLFALSGMAGLIAVLGVAAGRAPRTEAPRRARVGRAPPPLRDPYLRGLAGLLLLCFAALTVGDYQFKAVARAAFREDELARFFSWFYAGTALLSLLLQFLLTPWLLRRLGVTAGLLAVPGCFGGAAGLLLGWPHLLPATLMKFADNGLQFTVQDTTLQSLYSPFPPETRARARALLEGAVKPLSYGLGGLLLALLAPRLEVHQLSLVSLSLVGGWLLLVPVVRRRHLRALEARLSACGGLGLAAEAVLDAAGRQALLEMVERGRPRLALLALETLAAHGEAGRVPAGAVERLVSRAQGPERAAALRLLPPTGEPGPALEALADPDPEVRAAAAEAAVSRLAARGAALPAPLTAVLDDPAPLVRTAVLAAVLERGGVEGWLAAGERLRRLLADDDPAGRLQAARVLGRLTGAGGALRRLLEDPVLAVRRAALTALARAPGRPGAADPVLLQELLRALETPATRHPAAAALRALGPAASPALCGRLRDPATPRPLRLVLPRLLVAAPARESWEAVWEALARERDGHVRLRLLGALAKLRRALGLPPQPVERLGALVGQEVEHALVEQAGWAAARADFSTPLLEEEMAFRRLRAERRVLRALELRLPPGPLRAVRRGLAHPDRRAHALEALDSLCPGPLRALVVPFLERTAAPPAPPADPEPFLRAEARHPNPFVAALALEALRRAPGAAQADLAREALVHPELMVREQALLLLRACGGASAREPDHLSGGHTPRELPVHTTLERVLLLKSAPMFAQVPAEDLAPLASSAEERSYAAGSVLCREGEPGDELFLILGGRVRVVRGGTTLAELGPGEAVGEMAVLDEGPRSATVEALEETEVLALESEAFYEVLHEQVEIAEGVIRTLVRRLREGGSA